MAVTHFTPSGSLAEQMTNSWKKKKKRLQAVYRHSQLRFTIKRKIKQRTLHVVNLKEPHLPWESPLGIKTNNAEHHRGAHGSHQCCNVEILNTSGRATHVDRY